MAERRGKEPLPQVQWKEEKRVLTLEKIPVLELELSVPQLTGGGRGGERISRYYQRLAGAWRSRWSRENYWRACLDLARCREASRPFRPWTARLSGEVLFQDENTLSIRMDAREVRGTAGPSRCAPGICGSCPRGSLCRCGAIFRGTGGGGSI